jgi:two-component system, NarL family, nitrate/nitrite response regulator NarL
MPAYRADEGMREAIIVVDDEPFSQECVVEALRGSFPGAMVDGVASVEDLYRPDGMTVALVLLKAAGFPTWDAISRAVKTLERYSPKAPVVLISANDVIDVFKAIAAGVQGVVPVTASLKVGVAALRLVMAGGTYYPRPGLNDLASPNGATRNGHSDPFQRSHSPPVAPGPIAVSEKISPLNSSFDEDPPPRLRTNGARVTFTTREADVLALLQKGHSNKWIADHLKLSENTIKVHIQHIMRKLHATNRTEAVVLSVSQLGTY